jgi:anti-sigma regulatory factor (Ser/Thr protein kinase)
VPHVPASAGRIRRQLSADLQARGIRAADVEEAALLVTELIGNSIRHARPLPGGNILVSWRIEGGRLQVRVTDGGSVVAEPHLAHAGPRDTRGRGLSIVDALASLWGVERSAGSTTVWACLPVRRTQQRRQPAAATGALGDLGDLGYSVLTEA